MTEPPTPTDSPLEDPDADAGTGEQSPATLGPNAGEVIGDRLAAELHETSVPEDRPTATRDLVHEMMQAGAESEITADLLRQELPPEEYTDADYAAYEAEQDEG